MGAGRHQQGMKIHEHHDHGLRPRQAVGETIAWRRRRLVEAGLDEGKARDVAVDLRLDLHALMQLTDRGCPPDLAVRILAPLGGEGGS